ncbi:hypothetical protein FXO38_20466 [Capsicum annuum]|nr:hypothetical protein FXO38_20466 [Capsicum annuum]
MDFVMGLPHTHHQHDLVQVIVDRMTKSAHFLPVHTSYSAEDYAKLYIKELVRLHGVPSSIISDKGTKFISYFWKAFQMGLGTQVYLSTVFHPLTDSQEKRTIQTLKDMLRAYPADFKGNIRRKDLEFEVNDYVYLKISSMKGVKRYGKKRKLSPHYVGPFRILSRFGKVAYELELPLDLASAHPVFHVSLLKKCIGDPAVVVPIQSIDIQNNLSYEEILVEILDYQICRLRNKKVPLVKVLWRNQSHKGATWEAEADMRTKYPHLFFADSDQAQVGTLFSNTEQNLKNDGHVLSINTRSGMNTMDPPLPATEVPRHDEAVVMRYLLWSQKSTLLKALEWMPGYAKFMKKLVTKKKGVVIDDVDGLHHYSVVTTRYQAQKKGDAGAFTILYYDVDTEMPIKLGKPFMALGRAMVNMEKGELKFRVNGSQDLSGDAEQEESSVVPQYEEGTIAHVQQSDVPQSKKGIEQAFQDTPVQLGMSLAPTHALKAPLEEKNLRCLMAGYSIDFAPILQHEIHDRAFGEMINLPFPFLIQSLYDESNLPEILEVDKRVLATVTTQMKSIKNLAYTGLSRRSSKPSTVPQAQTNDLSVSIEPSNVHRGDEGVGIDIKIGKQRESSDISI